MTIASSSALRSASDSSTRIVSREVSSLSILDGAPISAAVSTCVDPVALIRNVSAGLVRSADPEAVFGSLVTAYAEHSGTHCTVELLTGTAVRVLRAPSCPAGGEHPAGGEDEQPSLSPRARQLLAGDGAPLTGAGWFVLPIGLILPIGAAASQPAGVEVPVGAFTCQFAQRRVDPPRLEAAQYLISVATELLLTEQRLATAFSQVANLNIALASNRDIGTAIGILMNAHLVTQDQAFTMLRTASQHGHRKLRDIANDVIFTGSLGTPPAADQARV